MPFGVTNAPLQFMHLVQDILSKYLGDFLIVFIDDILVFPNPWKEHAKHLRLVFQRLKKQHIYAKGSKCITHVQELKFLGQWVTTRGVAAMRAELHAMPEWETPTTSQNQGSVGRTLRPHT